MSGFIRSAVDRFREIPLWERIIVGAACLLAMGALIAATANEAAYFSEVHVCEDNAGACSTTADGVLETIGTGDHTIFTEYNAGTATSDRKAVMRYLPTAQSLIVYSGNADVGNNSRIIFATGYKDDGVACAVGVGSTCIAENWSKNLELSQTGNVLYGGCTITGPITASSGVFTGTVNTGNLVSQFCAPSTATVGSNACPYSTMYATNGIWGNGTDATQTIMSVNRATTDFPIFGWNETGQCFETLKPQCGLSAQFTGDITVGSGADADMTLVSADRASSNVPIIGWDESGACMTLLADTCGGSSIHLDIGDLTAISSGSFGSGSTVVGSVPGLVTTEGIAVSGTAFFTGDGVVIGNNGTSITEAIIGNVSVDIGAIALNASATTTVAVTNLQANSACSCSFRTDPQDDYLMKDCYSTAGNINVRMYNAGDVTAPNPAAVTMDYLCAKS